MIPNNMRIFIASTPVHMGRSFGGLEKIVSDLGHDAESPSLLVVFFNRKKDKLKLLWRDESGQIIFYKSLNRGSFRIPDGEPGSKKLKIDRAELELILEGVVLPPRSVAAKTNS
ncbi:MAG: IS66 family insertion sequence element accessory protein TnpB, partial [Deltaproteobacteria bacterium]|nr:IS66 family insertion sequence element accessory protein TnpB [Deltaproteobacteria bacterium]